MMGKARVIYGRVNRYFDGDEEIDRATFDKRFKTRIVDLLQGPSLLPSQTPACWPKTSHAMAVLPSQVEAAMEADRKLGVPTDYKLTADGYAAEPIMRDRGHRKEYLKAHGCRDNEAGYGD